MPAATTPPEREPSRRRGYLIAAGAGAVAILLVVGLVYTIAGWIDGRAEPAPPPAPTTSAAPPAAGTEVREWASEQELIQAPMLDLPEAAGQPHTLTTDTTGPPITLPQAGRTVGVWVPDSFPATPEGAVAQLVAMTQTGMLGADPADYTRAFDSIAEPGAAGRGDQPWLALVLADFRKKAGLPAHGPYPGMSITWTPRAALVKGAVGDRFVVACVLGESSADYKGQVTSAGVADCQAMRRVATPDGEQWRIVTGLRPAIPPSPWPGTAEAVAAGYRDLVR